MKLHEDIDGYTINQHKAMLDTVNFSKNRFHLISLDRSAQISRKMSINTTSKLFRKPGKRCAAVIEMYQGVNT